MCCMDCKLFSVGFLPLIFKFYTMKAAQSCYGFGPMSTVCLLSLSYICLKYSQPTMKRSITRVTITSKDFCVIRHHFIHWTCVTLTVSLSNTILQKQQDLSKQTTLSLTIVSMNNKKITTDQVIDSKRNPLHRMKNHLLTLRSVVYLCLNSCDFPQPSIRNLATCSIKCERLLKAIVNLQQ